jgi:hypothetical protein
MLQIITFNGQEYEYVKPYYLLKVGSINLIKGFVIGSTLGWKLGGEFLSYNQLKNKLKNKN